MDRVRSFAGSTNMPVNPHPTKTRRPASAATADDTPTRLVRAAMLEFNESGFGGTDTNRIARRAGFAPQTFYRWFKDKTDVFINAYRLWETEEREMISGLLAKRASADMLVEACVAHHRAHLRFRRSLRQLSLEDPVVRAARAESRLRQIEQIKRWRGTPRANAAEIATALLQFERLSDALAEGEIADLGLDERAARKALAALLRVLRSAQ